MWARSSNNAAGAATGPTNTQFFDLLAPLEVAGASHLGVTVGPVKFNLNAILTGTPTAGGPPNLLKLGFIVWSAAPTTPADLAISTHPELDWMWINTFYYDQNAGAVLLDRTPDPGYFEVRSKRRLEELNQTLLLVMEHGALNGATAFRMDFNAFVMVTLP